MSKKRRRRRKNGRVLIWLLLAAALVTAGTAGFQLYRIISNYMASNRLYSQLSDQYVDSSLPDGGDTQAAEREERPEWADLVSIDYESLKAENPDLAGWLYFEDDSISYPVMYSGDDSTYLHTAFDGTYAYAGSLFIEGTNTNDFSDSHTIIYGHNMRNLSMFGKLKYYYRDSSYYEDHQYFQIITESAIYRYHIFAYEEVSDSSFIYTVPYGNTEEFDQFIAKIRAASLLDSQDQVTSADHIITLSTCTSGNGRFAVHAVRVGEAEK